MTQQIASGRDRRNRNAHQEDMTACLNVSTGGSQRLFGLFSRGLDRSNPRERDSTDERPPTTGARRSIFRMLMLRTGTARAHLAAVISRSDQPQ